MCSAKSFENKTLKREDNMINLTLDLLRVDLPTRDWRMILGVGFIMDLSPREILT